MAPDEAARLSVAIRDLLHGKLSNEPFDRRAILKALCRSFPTLTAEEIWDAIKRHADAFGWRWR